MEDAEGLFVTVPASKSRWSDRLLPAVLLACAICLPRCSLDGGAAPERSENYITVRLNDSLKRYDSVDVAILVAGDTSQVVGRMWSGKLPDPSVLPSYRLADGEDRPMSIRVRAFSADGALILDMLISRKDGKQTITDLPVPGRPGTHPGDPGDTLVVPPIPIHPAPVDSLFPGWRFRRAIDIRLDQIGLAPGKGVRNFPLLVRLDGNAFDFSQADGAGADLRFADKYGHGLPYEISRWNPQGNGKSGGGAEIWVRMDSLIAGNDSEWIVMGWGNPSATPESDGAKVFPASDGYGTVLHLSEEGKGKASEFRDATGRYAGTGGAGDGNNVPKRVDGVVGYGQDFRPGGLLDGIFDPILGTGGGQGTINLPSNFDPGTQSWTFQAWVKRSGNGVLFQKGDSWVAGKQRFQINCRKKLDGQVSVEREGAENMTSAYLASGQFVDLGVVYSGGRIEVYTDGVLRDTQNWTQGGEPNCRTVLGAFSRNGDDEGFNGVMDEVWIGSAPRPAEWIRIGYENQKPGSRFAELRPR